MTDHKGLPVAGYRPQSDDKVALVNQNKLLEEELLRRLDYLCRQESAADDGSGCLVRVSTHNPRWLAIARTHLEEGFMAMNRAIFQPERVKLPGDGA